ncbi:MAG: DEAD/DEAH box helicase [Micrococcales bacterium]|nr:DEAD/DEAH box helicase [Micrococcales bacterium]
MTTPAESYAAFRRRRNLVPLEEFAATLGFDLDPYQIQACEALLDGKGVLVAAPTGAGKTVVGSFALTLALSRGEKAFYTTPIKALSNQKYRDFCATFGSENVGLLTGDVAINGRAAIVVMTTEVLRNMMYTNSPDLTGLGVVVLDEVHYLADRFRGPVWEEVLIQLPDRIQMVCLSATVSNAEEFGAWLAEVRGEIAVIVSEHRPVPLWQHVLTSKAMLDLYLPGAEGDETRLNPELEAYRPGRHGHGPPGHGHSRGKGARRNDPRRSPPRFAVVEALDRDGLLPAIFFVFSRAGCEKAVDECLTAGLRLTSRTEARDIANLIDAAAADISPADLEVLGFSSFRAAAEAGFAAHHAGLLPAFKQAIELAFQQGLVKCVFATETLSLGINMPARTVAMDRLDKWNGSEHAALTPGEYTQLTGRAGRRGIDVEGHAVVVIHRDFDPQGLGSLASKRTYPLRSAFRPTYNMAVNLIERVGRANARAILELSFAQFQADRAIVGLARQVRQYDEALAGYRAAMTCDAGDALEYMELRAAISQAEKDASRAQAAARADANARLLSHLSRGDIVHIRHGKHAGQALILDPGLKTAHDGVPPLPPPHPLALTQAGKVRRVPPGDIASGLKLLGHVKVPQGFSGRSPKERSDMKARMRQALEGKSKHGGAVAEEVRASARVAREGIEEARARLKRHPVHGCPDREAHARWAHRIARAEKERAGVVERMESRTASIARDFDRVCEVLARLGYLTQVAGEASGEVSGEVSGEWKATDAGRMLGRIYAEKDIVVAQALRSGLWEGASGAELAAVVAALVYDPRRDAEGLHLRAPHSIAAALEATAREARRVGELEAAVGLGPTGDLDAAACGPMLAWGRGGGLGDVLGDALLTAGDFVRLASQVVDLLGQVEGVAPTPELRAAARDGLEAVHRGVVRASPG